MNPASCIIPIASLTPNRSWHSVLPVYIVLYCLVECVTWLPWKQETSLTVYSLQIELKINYRVAHVWTNTVILNWRTFVGLKIAVSYGYFVARDSRFWGFDSIVYTQSYYSYVYIKTYQTCDI